MASPTRWTWIWASSRRWWRTGKPGVLQSMRVQRVGHDWATGQQHTQGECRMKREAELGVMLPQDKEGWQFPGNHQKQKERPGDRFSQLSERVSAAHTLISDFSSQIYKMIYFWGLSHLVCGTWLWQVLETTTPAVCDSQGHKLTLLRNWR